MDGKRPAPPVLNFIGFGIVAVLAAAIYLALAIWAMRFAK